jgi:hypothetical protein
VKLSNELLLNIFRYYLDACPRFWPRLVHICRKWRHIVFESQQALHLRLFCTHGTPVLKTLGFWPALPIVVQYGGAPSLHPPALEDEDEIMAALKHSDRVSSISLTITSSLLEKLSSIERPFSELEDLALLSRDSVQQTFPNAFRCGVRLRTLHLTRAAIPALPKLISPSTGLVDLHLHDIPALGYFSPEAFADALSEMTQLRSLSVRFLSHIRRQEYLGLPPHSEQRIVLPALTHFSFRGTSTYLDNFVARVDAPRLGDIDITFFRQSAMNNLQLGRFIDWTEIQSSLCRAEIRFSERTTSVSFTQPEPPTRLKLQVSCKQLNWQWSCGTCLAQICKDLSSFLLGVEHLRISAARPLNRWDYGWKDLICSFRGTKWIHLSGNELASIVLTFRDQYVLPALHKICVQEHGPRYAPLNEAVVSSINSRRLSGQILCVEYERVRVDDLQTGTMLVQCQFVSRTNFLGAGPFSQQVTSEMLPDDILLNIFRLYLHSSPQFWPMLTHVSRRWRHLVFTSPLGLDLRLHCTYGTPVSKTLDCWPALPIVLQYGGPPAFGPPAPEDEDNIVAALKHSDRVTSIDLTITSSLQDRLSAIEMPLLELEDLVVRSLGTKQLTFPSTVRWGTRLRKLHSTGVAFAALPERLSPCTGLVDLQLHEIPNVGYFSPEVFANALSGITQLEKLSLHFLSFPTRRNHLDMPPQSGERVVLPALTHLKYRGTSKYLDNFVAKIDAPRLGDIDITFLYQPTMDASQLGRFIERMEVQLSFSQAEIQFSEPAISISFTQPSSPTRLELRISCKQLDWQLSSIAQICHHFSPFIVRVEHLRIKAIQPSSMQGDMDRDQLLKFLLPFRGVKDFHADVKLMADVLRLADSGNPTEHPSLRTLGVLELKPMHKSLLEAVKPFDTTQWLAGHRV